MTEYAYNENSLGQYSWPKHGGQPDSNRDKWCYIELECVPGLISTADLRVETTQRGDVTSPRRPWEINS